MITFFQSTPSGNHPMTSSATTSLLDDVQSLCARSNLNQPLVVVSPAGAGKTRTLVARILHMVKAESVPPYTILGLTFSRKAAEELRQRIGHECGDDVKIAHQLHLYTFHAFALCLLRRHHDAVGLPQGFTVLDRGRTVTLLREIIETYLVEKQKNNVPPVTYSDDRLNVNSADKIAKHISSRKERGIGPNTNSEHGVLYRMYNEKLTELSALDFSDFVPKAVQMLKSNDSVLQTVRSTYRHILVDEFQDVSANQLSFLQLLVNPEIPRVTVVGDANQAIYGFRGGLHNAFKDFFTTFSASSNVHRLATNYRSTQEIIDFSGAVFEIATTADGDASTAAPAKTSSTVVSARGHGKRPSVHLFDAEMDEVEGIALFVVQKIRQEGVAPKDIAVLCRVGTQILPLFVAALKHNGVPVTSASRIQRQVVARQGVQVLFAYARLALFDDDDAFACVYNTPRRGLREHCLEYLHSVEKQHNVCSLVAALAISSRSGYPPSGERKLTKPQMKGLDNFLEIIKQLRMELGAASSFTSFIKKIAVDICPEAFGKTESKVNRPFRPQLSFQQPQQSVDTLSDDVLNGIAGLESVFSAAEQFEARSGNEDGSSVVDMLTAFMDDARALAEDEDYAADDTGRVVVSTVHQAKGLEWPVVFVVRCVEGVLPSSSATSPENIEEERRLFYVSTSRAIRELHVSTLAGGGQHPSRFLFDVPLSCYEIKDWSRDMEERNKRPSTVHPLAPLLANGQ